MDTLEKRPTILVIDDEPIVHLTLESLLSGLDVRLVMAEGGLRGLELASTVDPDLVLLDVIMSGMDGFEVCRRIRANPGLAGLPVIMITALDDRRSRLEGLRAGADDFLTKPFDSFELMARVQTLTRISRYRSIVEQRRKFEILQAELLVSYRQTLEGWAEALELRSKETSGHARRIMGESVEFAKAIGISEEKELDAAGMGALLHDIGTLAVPDSILFKQGKLSEEDWVIMRQHPGYAYKWLSPIGCFEAALQVPYCHHEKWDGSGYPRGLKGSEIPLSARLFAIIDVWDAMSSRRPYRGPLPKAEVLAYIGKESGRHFDPELSTAFLKLQEKV